MPRDQTVDPLHLVQVVLERPHLCDRRVCRAEVIRLPRVENSGETQALLRLCLSLCALLWAAPSQNNVIGTHRCLIGGTADSLTEVNTTASFARTQMPTLQVPRAQVVPPLRLRHSGKPQTLFRVRVLCVPLSLALPP